MHIIQQITARETEALHQALLAQANNYQILVSKVQLQEIETQSEHFSDEEDAADLNGISLSKLFAEASSGESESEPDENVFIQMYSDLAMSSCFSVTLYGTYADQECQTDESLGSVIDDLQYQNKRYLSLGLSWKKKCEAAELRIRTITKEHAKEVQHLYNLLGDIRVK